jgi:hypothetical protein
MAAKLLHAQNTQKRNSSTANYKEKGGGAEGKAIELRHKSRVNNPSWKGRPLKWSQKRLITE